MSAQALQRVVTRMLFDSQFAKAVYADPATALAGLGIAPERYRWLTAPDPRRWRADPMRRFRALSALLEEFPVSGAWAARLPGGLAQLNTFFSDPAFHACVQGRGSMALSFGGWLQAQHGAIEDVVTLETAIARVRRPAERPPGLGLGPGVALAPVRSNTLDRWSAAKAQLAAHAGGVVGAVVDTQWPMKLPPCAAGQAILVVETGAAGPAVSDVTGALGTFLCAFSQGPLAIDRAHALLAESGVPVAEFAEIIDDLCAQGLLSRP